MGGTTFSSNMRLPVHGWFRYSAGYAAAWAEAEIRAHARDRGDDARVLDPFAGSGTTLLAGDAAHVPSVGFEAQPFVARVCGAKLQWDADPDALVRAADAAAKAPPSDEPPADLVRRCFTPDAAARLLGMRDAVRAAEDDILWLAFVAILRRCSHAGTAPWQYVLPARRKRAADDPAAELLAQARRMASDMREAQRAWRRGSRVVALDARRASDAGEGAFTLVLTSPPYANNFDYADATRVEMSVLGEVDGWGTLAPLRRDLVPSCTQHVAQEGRTLDDLLREPLLAPILPELERACARMTDVAPTRGGRKPYDRMVAAYFGAMARHFEALARVVAPDARLAYVVGDSAPYGVHVPTEAWLARLAEPHGFGFDGFEKVRDRNVKWKNRKHRVPLREGVLRMRRG